MKIEDYPPQEPLSEAGRAYAEMCVARSLGIDGEEFAFGDDPYQRLLLFRAPATPARVLLFWHGGGWTSGYKEWLAFMAPPLNAAGITFVSSGYRLAPQHVFPSGLVDCVAAIDWVRERLPGSPVFVGGHSAGGHYAALIAAEGARRIQGCHAISGVYQFGEGSGLPVRPRFLGPDGNDRRASPMFNLRPPLAPFLLAYGTKDFPHLVSQAERFADAVRACGGHAETVAMEGRTHFTASMAGGEANGPWVQRAAAFMDRWAEAAPAL